MKYRLFEQMIKEFTEKEIKPLAAEIDETERFPTETVKKMGKVGLMGLIVPTNYGGAGADYRMYINAVEEISKSCGTTGVVLSAHTSLCVAPILEFGSEEQKQKYLPLLCDGTHIGAFALTEPNAGTDANSIQTTAVLSGDEYILSGNKIFITNGEVADIYIVIACTGIKDNRKEFSAFIVEKGTKGFSFGKKELKMGIRGSSTCELIFNNCKIPANNLLGRQGEGLKIAFKTLDGGRIGIAAQALGIAKGAFEETVKYVKERKQFGKPISAFQNTQFVLADLDTKIKAAELLVYHAQKSKDENLRSLTVDAARAKLYASEVAMEVTTKAVQLLGGYGYTREYPVERMMRDAKVTEIYEGTSEAQRMIISSAFLRG